MALSTLAQLKHRQLLYGVSTRLSQENIKNMMYLAGVEQQLQESISSATDFFTILEQKGLLSQHNYTHLISLLETIGRIDLIKTICSDHQAPAVVSLPPDKFPVAEQLAILKRAQILRKRKLYLQSMQKLDTLCNSTSIHQQMSESRIMHTLSLIHFSEIDSISTLLPQCFNNQIICTLLRSVSLFSSSMPTLFHHFLVGQYREFECLAVLCRQHWSEFCAKVPKDYAPLTESLHHVHSLEYTRDSLIGKTVVEIHQSLQEVFSELLGPHSLITVADNSFSMLLVNGQVWFNFRNYLFPIMKWLIHLLQAVEQGHVDGKNVQDAVLILASSYKQQIVENTHHLTKILGQDLLDKILMIIPDTNREESKALTLDNNIIVNKTALGVIASTCVVLLVHATTPKNPQTESQSISLKSVLPRLQDALLTNKEESSDFYVNYTKLVVSNIQREALMYKTKCEQLIETITDGSTQPIDILQSLFNGP